MKLSSGSTILIVILLAAFGVRVLALDSKSLWLDETLSLFMVESGQAAIWAGQPAPDQPPLYFGLLAGWMQVADAPFHLRYLSALAGLLCAPLGYALAQELMGRERAITAGWLIALSPLLVWYSQEIRNYSLLVCFALAGTTGLVYWLTRTSVAGWLLFVSGTAAAFYTHYAAIWVLPVHAVLYTICRATGRSRPISLWGGLLGWGVILLLYLPWLRSPAARVFADLIMGDHSFYAQRVSALFGVSLRQLMLVFLIGLIVLGPPSLWLLSLLVRRAQAVWGRIAGSSAIHAVLVVLFIAMLALSVIPRGYSVKRQLLVLLPYGLLIFALFWPWRSGDRRRLLPILALSTAAALFTVLFIPKDEWRETVAYVTQKQLPNDVVVVMPSYLVLPFDYYDRQSSQRVGIQLEGAIATLDTLRAEHPRIWLITHTRDQPDPERTVQRWLEEHLQQADQRSFYRLDVRLYTR